MGKIRIAIAGVGNCASSLVQGFDYYRDKSPENAIGLMHWEIGGYRPFPHPCDADRELAPIAGCPRLLSARSPHLSD